MGEEEQFDKAVKYVNGTMKDSGIKLSNEQKLQLYSFFKQATVGTCNAPKPGFFDFEGKLKWDSWSQLGNMDKSTAMKNYSEVLQQLVPNWNQEGNSDAQTNTQKDTNTTGDMVAPRPATNRKSAGFGPVFSTLVHGDPEKVPEHLKDICYWSGEGDAGKVKEKMAGGASVDSRDVDQRTPLMWAADRGQIDIVDLLIQAGANVNSQDNEGMTPLHYAAMCEYANIITLLMKNKADPTIKDVDGKTPRDVADENIDLSLFDVK